MTVIDKLASSLNRRDEAPNQELAKRITDKNDRKAVQELVANLGTKSKAIQSDCIKVLYEIGERKPEFIADNVEELGGVHVSTSFHRLSRSGLAARA